MTMKALKKRSRAIGLGILRDGCLPRLLAPVWHADYATRGARLGEPLGGLRTMSAATRSRWAPMPDMQRPASPHVDCLLIRVPDDRFDLFLDLWRNLLG